MPETKRKNKESFEALLRRFNKLVQQSGRLIQAKKVRYYKKSENNRSKKESAMRRMKIEGKKDYLKRIGKLKDKFPGTKALMKLK